MTILDATVVNIALPHIQAGLGFSSTSLSWVMNGYTLTFGGLLLLGGRMGDILGRRRTFLAGIVIFTLASLAGGPANSAGLLLAARAVQRVGGALASPAVLALVVSGFPEGRERVLFGVSRLAPRMIPVFGGKRLMIIGMLPMIAGMAWLSRVSPGTAYWSGVFPPMVLFGLGGGVSFVPLTTASLAGVRPGDSGAASSMVNVMQQVGGSLGLAVLVAVFGTASRGAAAQWRAAHSAASLGQAAGQHYVLAHGMSAAFGLAALFDVATLLLVIFLFRADPRPAAAAAAAGGEQARVPAASAEPELG